MVKIQTSLYSTRKLLTWLAHILSLQIIIYPKVFLGSYSLQIENFTVEGIGKLHKMNRKQKWLLFPYSPWQRASLHMQHSQRHQHQEAHKQWPRRYIHSALAGGKKNPAKSDSMLHGSTKNTCEWTLLSGSNSSLITERQNIQLNFKPCRTLRSSSNPHRRSDTFHRNYPARKCNWKRTKNMGQLQTSQYSISRPKASSRVKSKKKVKALQIRRDRWKLKTK